MKREKEQGLSLDSKMDINRTMDLRGIRWFFVSIVDVNDPTNNRTNTPFVLVGVSG